MMGDLKTNRDALEQVLERMLPASPRDVTQQALEQQQAPVRAIPIAAGAAVTWQQYDMRGYAIMVLPGDPSAQLSATPMYVRLGTDAPPDATSTEGAIPAYPGSIIEMPQSSARFWVLSPDAATSWLVCVVRIPHVRLTPGPLAARLPNQQVLSVTTAAVMAAAPTVVGDGIAVPAQAVRVRIQGLNYVAPTYSRLSASSTAQVWTLPAPTGTTPRLWSHNQNDDFAAGYLEPMTADHDAETFEVAGLSRVAVVTSASDLTHVQCTWLG